MSEIFRDIERELRQERWLSVWKQAQPYVIGVVMAIVLLGGGWTGWRYYARTSAERASNVFDDALILQDKTQRVAAFADLAKQGGSYGALAAFHEAAGYTQEGRWKQAADIYDGLSKLARLPPPLRDLARINAASVLIGHASYEEIAQRLRRAGGENAPLRYSAREVMALAALQERKYAEARAWLVSLTGDQNTPPTLAARARIMLDNLPSQKKSSQNEPQAK